MSHLENDSMISMNYRMAVKQFITISLSDQAHSTQLTENKKIGEFVDMGDVRGESNSHIEKMTHPLARPSETDHLSPYMIDLLGETTLLAFAEKALQAPGK